MGCGGAMSPSHSHTLLFKEMNKVETLKKKQSKPKKTTKEKAVEKQDAIETTEKTEQVPSTEATSTEATSNKITMDVSEFEELKKYKGIVRQAREKKAAKMKIAEDHYEYFGDFEKGSSIPARDMTTSVDMLEQDVSSLKGMIDRNEIPLEELPYRKADLEKMEKRLEEIKNSKPKLSGIQRDRLARKRDKLAEEIKASKFSVLDMEKGLADPHEEARRMSEPCIDVSYMLDELPKMKIKLKPGSDKKVSRSVAEGMWKMMNGLLDDDKNPNAERLRPDQGSLRKRSRTMVKVKIVGDKVLYEDPENPGEYLAENPQLVALKEALTV